MVLLLVNSPGQTCSAHVRMQVSGVGTEDCAKETVLAKAHKIMNWRVFMFEIQRRGKSDSRNRGPFI